MLEELCVCDVPAGEDGCVAAAAGPCGDVNKDGVVNVSDLLEILSRFGSDGSAGGDATADGIVNVADVLLTLSQFGGSC